jgi:hypothetical protein
MVGFLRRWVVVSVLLPASLSCYAGVQQSVGASPNSKTSAPQPAGTPTGQTKKAATTKKKTEAQKKKTPTKAPDTILEAVCSVRSEKCVSFAGKPAELARKKANGATARTTDVVPIQPTEEVTKALEQGQECEYLKRSLSSASTADAQTVQKNLGAVAPFTIQASGDDVFIYSSIVRLSVDQSSQLSRLEHQIGVLVAASEGAAVSFEIPVPHAAALGGSDAIVKMVQAIMPAFTVTAIGPGWLRITASSAPDCDSLKALLEDVRRYAHHTKPDTPVATALYMDLASLGTALNATPIPFAMGGASIAAAASTAAPPAATPTSSTSTPASAAAPTSPAPTVTITTTPAAAPATPAAGSTPSGTASSGTTPPASTTGSSTTTPAASTTPPATSASTTTITVGSAAPAAAPAAAPTTAPAFSVNGKNLYFTDATPGDDAGITEKKRALALLDLPQPQVLINAWVVQDSTSNPKYAGVLTNLVHDLVDEYNDVLQKTVAQGWVQVAGRTLKNDYFEPSFYNYITQRTIFEPRSYPKTQATSAEKVLNEAAGMQSSVQNLDPRYGICSQGQYCLGYQTFFRPVKPRLIDLLLTLIAANRPLVEADQAINVAEGLRPPGDIVPPAPPPPVGLAATNHGLRQKLFGASELRSSSCEDRDKEKLIVSVEVSSVDERMPLECFRDSMLLVQSTTDGAPLPSYIGSVRAAVADFLFNYKLSQEYPHEFVPYDLTQSAQNLDSTLAPLITAFNDDLRAFTTFLHARLETEIHDKGLEKDSKGFMNGGILTVRTTSGDASSVNTATQSYLDASKAPTPAQLIGNILSAQPGGATGSPLTGVAANLSYNQAQVLMGALQSYQSTSVNIGRQLNLLVRPRSLTGAQAVEMDVQLNVDDTPNAPTYFTPGPGGGPGTAADISRVSQHDIVTHVRVDSLRLFEISSLTAVLSKGRDRFPLLPPFVELPYIGTLAGIPLRAAKEYHNSSAIMSAVIVPTASDIAFSLRFVADRVVVGHPEDDGTCVWPPAAGKPCTVRTANSLADFAGQPIREFHQMRAYCLATLNQAPYPTPGDAESKVAPSACANLTFADAVHEEE